MTNITQKVWNFIEKDPSIKNCLSREIVNMMALSNYIRERIGFDATGSSIISAIRRYPIEKVIRSVAEISDVLRAAKISTKTRISVITIKRDFKLLSNALPLIMKTIDPSSGEMLRLVEGRESVKVLIDQEKSQEVITIVGNDNVFDVRDGQAELNINLGDKNKNSVKGVRATLLNELAINNISVGETFSCLPEFIIYVNEKDVAKAHQVLIKFCYSES